MIDPSESRACFISLHEILCILVKAKGYSPQEAAQMLSQTITRDARWQRLEIQKFDLAAGLMSATRTEANLATNRLARFARTGDSLTEEERDCYDIPF